MNQERRTVMFPGKARPALTDEEYQQGRALLDMLPPGIYLKCSRCKLWQRGGDVLFLAADALCERCAQNG